MAAGTSNLTVKSVTDITQYCSCWCQFHLKRNELRKRNYDIICSCRMCLIQHVYFIGSLSRQLLSLGVRATTSNLYQMHASTCDKAAAFRDVTKWTQQEIYNLINSLYLYSDKLNFEYSRPIYFAIFDYRHTKRITRSQMNVNPDQCVDAKRDTSRVSQLKSSHAHMHKLYAI